MRRAAGTARRCKVNYAACVSLIMPLMVAGPWLSRRGAHRLSLDIMGGPGRCSLDAGVNVGIIVITHEPGCRGDAHAQAQTPDPKLAALRQHGCLNPHPERVADPLFACSDFFDARDLVQVKYEMVRRVRVDGQPVSHSAAAYGFSRPVVLSGQSVLDPRRPGGSGAEESPDRGESHKLSADVMEFLQRERSAGSVAARAGLGAPVWSVSAARFILAASSGHCARQEKKLRDRRLPATAGDDRPSRVLRGAAAGRADGRAGRWALRGDRAATRRGRRLAGARARTCGRGRPPAAPPGRPAAPVVARRDPPAPRRACWPRMALASRSGVPPVTAEVQQKITARHLARNAYLYIRQSTLHQVLENTESTRRQYELRQRALALGWPEERIVVIDSDLGQSGASAKDREGFQTTGRRGRHGPRGHRHGLGGFPPGAQLQRLAPPARDLCPERHLDPGRGRYLRPGALQRPAASWAQGHHERGRVARAARSHARRLHGQSAPR